MAINLKKGGSISLKKVENDLSIVTVGLGWDVAEEAPAGFMGKLFKKKVEEYDLDAVAVLLGENGKIFSGADIVFYNKLEHDSGKVRLTGDNRTGAGDGDDEQVICRLQEVPPQYKRIVFIVQIYQGRQKGQTFGGVKNAYIRAVDARDKEMARFDISRAPELAGKCSMVFAELKRNGDSWDFTAIGEPHDTDSFNDLVKRLYA